jgi:hypothetical protein
MWLNPDVPEDDVITWLKEGAKFEPQRCLGHRAA